MSYLDRFLPRLLWKQRHDERGFRCPSSECVTPCASGNVTRADVHDRDMTSEEHTAKIAWPGSIAAVTLFVEDLESAKHFYQDVFQLPVFFENGNSAVFKFGETLVNLLRARRAA